LFSLSPGKRKVLAWTAAIAGSLALNLALFGVMPALMESKPEKRAANPLPVTGPVRVRLPRPETRQPPEPPPPEMTPRKTVPAPDVPPPLLEAAAPGISAKDLLPEISADPPMPPSFSPPPPALSDIPLPPLDRLYDPADLDAPLAPVSRRPPEYPPRARRRNVEGRVVVSFVVTEEGTVRDPEVVSADPEGYFEEAAIDAVRSWRFAPGRVKGEPVTVRVRVPLAFRLE